MTPAINQDLLIAVMTIVVLILALFHYIPRIKAWREKRRQEKTAEEPLEGIGEEKTGGGVPISQGVGVSLQDANRKEELPPEVTGAETPPEGKEGK